MEQDEPRFVIPDPDPGTTCPPGWLWLVYLYFRPRTFFTHFVIDSTPGLTALCAWFFGMAGVIDRFQIQALKNPDALEQFTWTSYWSIIVFGGLFGGLFYYLLGGWWYRVRLELSGAEAPDKKLARRVYVFASMVWALPAILGDVIESNNYSSPSMYFQSEGSFWHLLYLIPMLWSIWASFRGVQTAFGLRGVRPVLWFLVFPVICYFGSVVFLGLLFFLQAAGPADVAHPLHFVEGQTMTFSYPGNWWIDVDDPDYEPDTYISVEPMHDAFVEILYFESDLTEVDSLSETVAGYEGLMSGLREIDRFDRWGRFTGTGRLLQGVIEGQSYPLRVFVSQRESGIQLEIHEMWIKDDEAEVIPGFKLIRSSFELN